VTTASQTAGSTGSLVKFHLESHLTDEPRTIPRERSDIAFSRSIPNFEATCESVSPLGAKWILSPENG